jgi:hypothetical protein
VVAVPEDDADPRVGAAQLVVGLADLADHLQVPGVALGGAVDADEQDVAVALDGHQAVGHRTPPLPDAGRRRAGV